MFLMISIYFYFTCQCAPQFSLGYKMLETTLKDNCNFLGFSKSPHLCEGKLVTDRSSVSFLIHIMLHTLHPVIFILFFWFYSELRRFILTIQLYRSLRGLFGFFFVAIMTYSMILRSLLGFILVAIFTFSMVLRSPFGFFLVTIMICHLMVISLSDIGF